MTNEYNEKQKKIYGNCLKDLPLPLFIKFWEILESINWERNCEFNPELIKIKLMKNYSREDITNASEFKGRLLGNLYKKINSYEEKANCSLGLGDDSTGDILNHVIGLGQEHYEKVLCDPSIIFGGDYKYEESFSYVFPYSEDWDKLEDKYWIDYADEILEKLINMRVSNKNSKAIIIELISRFLLVKDSNFKDACEGFSRNPTMKSYSQRMYDRFYKWEENEYSALFSNILSDIFLYKVLEDKNNPVSEDNNIAIKAIADLVEVGLACKRCDWDLNQTLWCTSTHSITPNMLLALENVKVMNKENVGCLVTAMKDKMIEMAIDGSFPSDMNELDLEAIVNEAYKYIFGKY